MTEENLAQVKKANFILRLWSGDVPLWKTYWIYGSLLGVILTASVDWLIYQINYYASDFSQFDRSVISSVLVTVIVTYSLVIFVSIWRSANKYRKSYLGKYGYATLAQIGVVLGVLASVGKFAEPFDNASNSIYLR
jgi:hypothetical protein